MSAPTVRAGKTSDDIPLGPLSEDDLRQQWNAQADEFSQWDSLETSEQLAWAQSRAIGADRYARAALKVEPETPVEALAARPLLEQVARLQHSHHSNPWGQMLTLSNRAAAWLRENPPGQPVAIEPRSCPTPGACSCVEPAPPALEQPLSNLMAQELADAEQRHGKFDTLETAERLGRCHSAMSARGDVQSAALCQHAATLLQQRATELAALRGMPVAGISDEHRDAVREAVAEALGNAYDCQRVWSAWNVGTMGPDDFVPIAEDDDRVAEIADAAIEAFRTFQVSAPQAGEGEA